MWSVKKKEFRNVCTVPTFSNLNRIRRLEKFVVYWLFDITMSDLGNDGHVYKKKWIRMVLHMILIDHNFAMKYVHLLLLRTVDNPPPLIVDS